MRGYFCVVVMRGKTIYNGNRRRKCHSKEIMGISVDWKWRNWLWSGNFLCAHSPSICLPTKEEGKPFDKFVILKWQFIFKICNFNILYMHARIKLFFYFASVQCWRKGKRRTFSVKDDQKFNIIYQGYY